MIPQDDVGAHLGVGTSHTETDALPGTRYDGRLALEAEARPQRAWRARLSRVLEIAFVHGVERHGELFDGKEEMYEENDRQKERDCFVDRGMTPQHCT